MKDGRIDGVIKGALLGLFLSALASQGLESSDAATGYMTKSVVSFAALGYLIDYGETNRRTLYRAPGQPSAAKTRPSVSLSFRF